MNLWILISILLIIAIGSIVNAEKASNRRKRRSDYIECKALLTANELKFYHALQKAVTKNEAIFPKVRQADIFNVNDNELHPTF